MMDMSRASLRFVSIRDQPVEDLVAEEPELATTRLAVRWDDPLTNPGTDDLLVRVQQLGELMRVHHGRHFGYQRS